MAGVLAAAVAASMALLWVGRSALPTHVQAAPPVDRPTVYQNEADETTPDGKHVRTVHWLLAPDRITTLRIPVEYIEFNEGCAGLALGHPDRNCLQSFAPKTRVLQAAFSDLDRLEGEMETSIATPPRRRSDDLISYRRSINLLGIKSTNIAGLGQMNSFRTFDGLNVEEMNRISGNLLRNGRFLVAVDAYRKGLCTLSQMLKLAFVNPPFIPEGFRVDEFPMFVVRVAELLSFGEVNLRHSDVTAYGNFYDEQQ